MNFRPLFLAPVGVAAALACQAAPPTTAAPSATPAAPAATDWRTVDPANLLVIDTNKGRILVELWPQVAPASVAQIVALTKAGFYNGRSFFRVIDGFMDQTGDPQDNGQGGSTRPNLPPEFTFRHDPSDMTVIVDSQAQLDSGFVGQAPAFSQKANLADLTADHKINGIVTFCSGVLGMARAQDPGSGNSQFFLMRGAQDHLNGQYTAAGRVVAGMDVVRQIKTGEPVADPQDKMLTVRLASDMPAAQRPTVRVVDTRSPWFAAEVARVKAQKLVGVSPCDIDIPSDVK
jgi:peptidylprolyl isomerase